MISYPYIEDYLEVIAGKRDPVSRQMVSGILFASFDPIINLARYDNSFLDSVTDATLNGTSLTDRQAELAVKLINKYQRQLATKGIGVEPVATPQYRKALRIISRAKTAEIVDGMIQLKFPYNAPMIEQIRNISKESQGSIKFDRDNRVWRLGLTEYNINWVCEFGKAFSFQISDQLLGYMQSIIDCEQQGYEMQLTIVDDNLVIKNATASLVEYVESKLGGFGINNLEILADYSSILGYTIDHSVQQALEMMYGGSMYLLITNKEYDLHDSPDSIERIVKYAQQFNRWPIVAFNPTPDDTLPEWRKYFDEDQVLVLKNQKVSTPEPTCRLIYSHRPVKFLDSIPLLISQAGMMVGSDKQIMLGRSEKIFYSAMRLK
jgi:uncharacterized protein YgfB (UPF0149 family)